MVRACLFSPQDWHWFVLYLSIGSQCFRRSWTNSDLDLLPAYDGVVDRLGPEDGLWGQLDRTAHKGASLVMPHAASSWEPEERGSVARGPSLHAMGLDV